MNPFVYEKKIKAAIISYKSDSKLKDMLNEKNIDIIETIKCKDVDKPVDDHPDLVVHPIDKKNIFVYYKHFDYYKEKLDKYGVNVHRSFNELNKEYPNDIYMNISRLKGYFFHKQNYIDKNIEKILLESTVSVEVKQGYAKCSSMIIKDDTVITTDYKLNKKYISLGFNSYLLPSGDIGLPGYNTGFIGGTCGNIGKDEILFYGNLEKYKHSKELIKILNYENIEFIYPNTEEFVDRGSIIGIIGG